MFSPWDDGIFTYVSQALRPTIVLADRKEDVTVVRGKRVREELRAGTNVVVLNPRVKYLNIFVE